MQEKMKTNTNTEKKAIAWVRCSTDKQHTTGEQLEAIRKLAEKDGYTADNLIVIGREGASAIKVDAAYKEDLDRMYDLMNNGIVSTVYAWAVDRVGRDTKENTFFKYKLLDCGIAFKTVEGVNMEAGEDGIATILLDLKQRIAEDEMKKKAARFKIGKDRNRKMGKYNGGKVLFGYTVTEDGTFTTDKEQSAIVRWVYDTFLGGTSARQIAKQLYSRGIINHTAEKSREVFVYKILKSPNYKGLVNEYGKVIYDRLVTDAEFDEAQAKLKDGQKAPRQVYAPVVSYGLGLLRVANSNAKNGHYMMQPHRADNQYWEYNSKFCINADLTDSLLLQVCDQYISEFSGMDVEVQRAELEAKLAELNVMSKTSAERADKAKQAIERIERRLAQGKISEQQADILRQPYDREVKQETEAVKRYGVETGKLLHQTLKVANGTVNDLYGMTDTQRAEEIKKYVSFVEVERVKNGTYNYTIHFTLTDRTERWQVASKKHQYSRWNGEDWEQKEIQLLNRYTDRRKADREKKRLARLAA